MKLYLAIILLLPLTGGLFNALFGRKFSSTYSEQIDEIKARRRRKN